MFKGPTKYSEYIQDVPKSIDYILKRVNAVTVADLQAVTNAGATTTLPINTGGITSDYFQFDTAATPTLAPGMFAWNDAYGTADLRLKGNNVTLQVGQETLARVVNKTGADLLESQYKVVRVRIASEGGAQGQRLAVVLAQGNNDPDSATTLGLVTENIANNQEGFITIFGNVNNINTTGSLQGETWVDGDVLYLSPTTPGAITKVKPVAPQHTVIIGYVVYAHNNNGKIFVKVDNGYELDELHNVLITSPANNDLLQYNSAQQVWKNVAASVAVPTPTLAQVTTAGNTTTNAITVGGLTTSGQVLFNAFGAYNTVTPTLRIENVDTNNVAIQIKGNVANYKYYWIYDSQTTEGIYKSDQARIDFYGGTNVGFAFRNNYGRLFTIVGTTGNVLINTTTDAGYKLDVVGADSRFNGVRVGIGAGGVSSNTVVGNGALNANTTGANITAVGYQSLYNNTVSGVTAIGFQSLYNNTAVGFQSNFSNLVGANNSSFGYYSLRSNTGYSNTAVGYYSLYANTASNNTAVGSDALRSNTASNNTAVGTQAAYSNTTAAGITAIGYQAGYSNTTALITAIGYFALKNNVDGSPNTAVGYGALASNVSSVANTAVGHGALASTTDGSNTAVGHQSSTTNSTGSNNSSFGTNSLRFNTTGIQNTAIGSNALTNSTGSFNVGLGYLAGSFGVANTTGSNNIFIGYQATGVSATDSNRTWIGNSSTTSTWLAGNVLIGTTTDAGYKLDVNGTARVQTSLEIVSTAGVTFGGGATALSWAGGSQLHLGNSATWTDVRFYTGAILKYSQTSSVTTIVNTTINLATTTVQLAGVNALTYSGTDIRIGSVSAGFNSLSLYVAGSEKARIDSSGNFGLGTTNPTDKIHIVDNTNGNKFGRISAGGTDASAAWVAQNDQVDNVVYRVFGSAVTGSQMGQALARSASLIANLGGTGKFLIGSFSGTDLIFGTSDQARMRLVDATGNFLIGTMTDNGNKLTVSGNIDAQGYKVNNVLGYTGILNIPTNPPGQQNIDIQGGIVVNIF